MKLAPSLLSAIAIGVTVTTAVATSSCEKEDHRKNKAQLERNDDCPSGQNCPTECQACGMG